MAATLAQPTFGLQPPTNDDTMEISSDFGAMDGDIDIDFDGAGEQMQYEEDDQMVDDVKSDRENPDDHVMLDDDITSNPGDREMQEAAPPQEVDEDLLDFSDIEDAPPLEQQPAQPVAQPVVEQSAPAAVNTPSHTLTPAPVSVPEEPLEQVQSDVAAELLNQGADVIDHTVQQGEQDQQPQTTILPEDQLPEQLALQEEEQMHEHSPHENAESTVRTSEEDAPQNQELAQAVPEDAVPEVTEGIEPSTESLDQTAQQHSALTAEESFHEQPAASVEDVDTNISASHVSDHIASQPVALTVDTESSRVNEVDNDNSRERQPDSPTVTGMHPTVVEYEDSEVYLFPPKLPQGTEQYLLENENLATTSLGDLLQACRSVLGDNLSEDEELVLGFEELDLYISEDSTPAFSTSFSELLEVYLSLHRHDGNLHPPPFRVTLTTKTRFTNRLTLITQAIAEGKGFSQLPFLQHYHLDAEAGFPLEEDFEDDEDDYREDDVHAMEQGHAEQSPEKQHEQSDNNINNTDNHVSEYATAQDQDHLAAAGQPEEPSLEDNGQDETQYYSPEGGDSYEEAQEEDEPEAQEKVQLESHPEVEEELQPEAHEEPQEQVEDQDQHEDTLAVVVQDTATGPDGENDDIDFSDDEDDDDSSLTTPPASAGGSPHAAQPDELSADQAALDDELAQATQEVDEVPAPPEDEQFSHEDYQEEAYQNEDDAIEDGQTEFTDAKTNDEAVAATTADVRDGNDVTQNESEGHDAQDLVDGIVQAGVVDGTEQHEQQEQHGQSGNVFDDDFNEDFSGEQNESLPVDGQNGHSSPREVTGGTVGNDSKAAYDPDTIDFDDDELDNEASSPTQHTPESESAKASPSIKRSYSERNEIQDAGDDEQALKKVRSS